MHPSSLLSSIYFSLLISICYNKKSFQSWNLQEWFMTFSTLCCSNIYAIPTLKFYSAFKMLADTISQIWIAIYKAQTLFLLRHIEKASVSFDSFVDLYSAMPEWISSKILFSSPNLGVLATSCHISIGLGCFKELKLDSKARVRCCYCK